MTAAVLIVLGAVLCFLGTTSIRVAVLVAGLGAGWLLAGAFGMSTSTQVLVAMCSAAIAFVVSFLASRFLLFIGGLVVGAVIGARLFTLAGGGDGDWLLALFFVPAVALACGFLAGRFRHRFLAWATAAAGAGLICSGIGRLGPDSTDQLYRPDTTVGTAVLAVVWVALTILGHRYQLGKRSSAKTEGATA
jgi:hypothetical protein